MIPLAIAGASALLSGATALASSLSDTAARNAEADRETLKRKSVEFEAVYLTQMLQPMFENLEAAEPFGGGLGQDVWRSMQVQEYGKALAANGGVGLADHVARELIAAQEAHNGERR
jgi:Rod binding domain-containing protein